MDRFERGGEIEMDVADADRAADLGVYRAQVAVLVVRQRLVLRLLRHRMSDAVDDRALLGEQQGEDEQRFQEEGTQHGRHSNRRPGVFQAWRGKAGLASRVIFQLVRHFAGSGVVFKLIPCDRVLSK